MSTAAPLTIETPDDRYGPLPLALRGEHQVGNALVAVRLLEAARRRGIAVPRDGDRARTDAGRLAGTARADPIRRWARRCCSTPRTTSTARGRSPRTWAAGIRSGRRSSSASCATRTSKESSRRCCRWCRRSSRRPPPRRARFRRATLPRASQPWADGVPVSRRARSVVRGRAGAREQRHRVCGRLDLRRRRGSRRAETPCYPALTPVFPDGFIADSLLPRSLPVRRACRRAGADAGTRHACASAIIPRSRRSRRTRRTVSSVPRLTIAG